MVRKTITLLMLFVILALLAYGALSSLGMFGSLDVFGALENWEARYAPARAEPVEPDNLQGKIIILDAGHGEETTNFYEGYDEQLTMLSLAWRIKPLLEKKGAVVLMTRPTAEDVPLPVRTAMINRWALQTLREARYQELLLEESGIEATWLRGEILEIDRLLSVTQSVISDPEANAPIYLNHPYDYSYKREIHPDWKRIFQFEDDPIIRERILMISLHSNATPKPIDTTQNGADSFYISNDLERNESYYTSYTNEEENIWFAERILDNISGLGMARGEAGGYFFHMIREHNIPGVLVENGYHTNKEDRGLLSDEVFLNDLALVYADTITEYFAGIWRLPEEPEKKGRYDDIFARWLERLLPRKQ